MRRDAFVVDTNVCIVANGKSSHWDELCVAKSREALEKIRHGGVIVLDDCMIIIAEYRKYLRPSGQPGDGDTFFKWVWDHRAVTEVCEQVAISFKDRGHDEFEQFPDDPELGKFHHDDRKFVAVAIASQRSPTILNAVDSDWWLFRKALKKHGVKVNCLCSHLMPDEMTQRKRKR